MVLASRNDAGYPYPLESFEVETANRCHLVFFLGKMSMFICVCGLHFATLEDLTGHHTSCTGPKTPTHPISPKKTPNGSDSPPRRSPRNHKSPAPPPRPSATCKRCGVDLTTLTADGKRDHDTDCQPRPSGDKSPKRKSDKSPGSSPYPSEDEDREPDSSQDDDSKAHEPEQARHEDEKEEEDAPVTAASILAAAVGLRDFLTTWLKLDNAQKTTEAFQDAIVQAEHYINTDDDVYHGLASMYGPDNFFNGTILADTACNLLLAAIKAFITINSPPAPPRQEVQGRRKRPAARKAAEDKGRSPQRDDKRIFATKRQRPINPDDSDDSSDGSDSSSGSDDHSSDEDDGDSGSKTDRHHRSSTRKSSTRKRVRERDFTWNERSKFGGGTVDHRTNKIFINGQVITYPQKTVPVVEHALVGYLTAAEDIRPFNNADAVQMWLGAVPWETVAYPDKVRQYLSTGVAGNILHWAPTKITFDAPSINDVQAAVSNFVEIRKIAYGKDSPELKNIKMLQPISWHKLAMIKARAKFPTDATTMAAKWVAHTITTVLKTWEMQATDLLSKHFRRQLQTAYAKPTVGQLANAISMLKFDTTKLPSLQVMIHSVATATVSFDDISQPARPSRPTGTPDRGARPSASTHTPSATRTGTATVATPNAAERVLTDLKVGDPFPVPLADLRKRYTDDRESLKDIAVSSGMNNWRVNGKPVCGVPLIRNVRCRPPLDKPCNRFHQDLAAHSKVNPDPSYSS